MKLKEFLFKTSKDYFYIMHLSYNGREKIRLWNYAKENKQIGLDSPRIVTNSWNKIREYVKNRLSKIWVRQFDLFCREMQIGDIVLVLDGWDSLLGIAEILNDNYQYKKELSAEHIFFDHVRDVDWIGKFEYDKSFHLPRRLNGFNNALSKVEFNTGRWNDLIELDINTSKAKENIVRIQRNPIVRKYGPGGEGAEHKKLKRFIAENPGSIGLKGVEETKLEYIFPSGDVADIVFNLSGNRYAVVEIETTNPLPGCFQALKYKILKCAELGLPITSSHVEAIMIAWLIPDYIKNFCRKYSVEFHKHTI
ncbi:MAG: hypothetical protein OEY22_08470 [Candidatus Bathyarchaeota archaeon]|nr:hypothetical protein [Candidatus Bathyarchaeota archaeon]MDH5787880.1 hypothetical protein [Candidatus Bathyarchaeota archaeon]